MQIQNDSQREIGGFDTIVQDTVLTEYMQLLRLHWEFNQQINTNIAITRPNGNLGFYPQQTYGYVQYRPAYTMSTDVPIFPTCGGLYNPRVVSKEFEDTHAVFHHDTDSSLNKNIPLPSHQQISDQGEKTLKKSKESQALHQLEKNIQKSEEQKPGGIKWSQQEDKLLVKYQQIYDGDWQEICKKIKGRNASQCFQRWRRMNPQTKQSATFTETSDAQIIELVKKFGHKWVRISKFLPEYKPKQIRDRYVNVLDDTINKAEFTNEEDQRIVNLYKQFGPKWKQIALQLKDRNDNDVKNRFYTQLRKRYFGIENRYQIVYKK